MESPPQDAKRFAEGASPWFARTAADQLAHGRAEEALGVCLEGTKRFPRYATGKLILGRCYEALGRDVEAILEYRRVLRALPDSVVVRRLVKAAEEREEQAFKAFTESQSRVLNARKQARTFDEYTAEKEGAQQSTVEFLLKQLQNAKKVAPPAGQAGPEEELPADREPAGKIVTATLAEIYATQGEYRAAIQAYKKLTVQRPGDGPKYERRIAELEELIRLQKTDSKL